MFEIYKTSGSCVLVTVALHSGDSGVDGFNDEISGLSRMWRGTAEVPTLSLAGVALTLSRPTEVAL